MKKYSNSLCPGKVKWSYLEDALRGSVDSDPQVLVGPGKGMDAAVVDPGEQLIVVATDPVTFATGDAARYAVHVNANDVAVLGARPRWFQAVLLLPDKRTTTDLPGEILSAIREELEKLGAVLVGGHTEVVTGLQDPIVVGQMIGQVSREALVRPGRAVVGDALLLAGGIAIEATALAAKEKKEQLLEKGVTLGEIAKAAAYMDDPGISIVRAALAAAATGCVHAMHDITEGGLITAVEELAHCSGKGVVLDGDSLQVARLTEKVLGVLGMDPLGSIGSGGLLISCPADSADLVSRAVRLAGSPCSGIGSMTSDSKERCLYNGAEVLDWPIFQVDEWARSAGSIMKNDS